MKIFCKKNTLKFIYIFTAILLALPSYHYIIKNKALTDPGFEFKFLFSDNNVILQVVLYFIIITLMVSLYLIILKHRNELFKNLKEVFIFTLIFSSMFIFILPVFSHDVYYYMGIGRLNSQYSQNPYYVSMKEFIDNESNDLELLKDEVMETGYKHYWANTTVVYGPIWTITCAILSKLSFGNASLCLLLFKLTNLLIHILNCYLIYKISKKKIFVLIYGLNPFMIIESIANVHNDIFMVFFILLAFYELLKKKSILKSVIFLGVATSIKYFAILFLPFTILYYFKKENPGKRLIKCIEYGLVFLIVVAIPYALYFRDLKVLGGIFEQQRKISKSLSIILYKYRYQNKDIPNKFLVVFAIYYIIHYIKLLIINNIVLRKEMKHLLYYLLIFVFILVTNFQPWYIAWFLALIIWQDSKNIKLTIQITIIALYTYIIFMIWGDILRVEVYYSLILLVSIAICILINNLKSELKTKLLRGEIGNENIEE